MSASSRSACPGAASPRGAYGHEAQDAQGQVYEVVPHGVAVLKQPQHVGHDEAEQAHQRVNHAHDQHHGAGNPLVSLAEAHIGKQAAGDQVDYVLDDVYVHQAQQQPIAEQQPQHSEQEEHYPHIWAYVLTGICVPLSR